MVDPFTIVPFFRGIPSFTRLQMSCLAGFCHIELHKLPLPLTEGNTPGGNTSLHKSVTFSSGTMQYSSIMQLCVPHSALLLPQGEGV